MERTFSREHWLASLDAWKDGEFSDEWKPYRHAAAMRGMIYPPEGTKWDSWEDDDPSERAMLIRAIRETPKLLSASIAQSRSWSEVVARVTRARDEWREDLTRRERAAAHERGDEPDPREATKAIKHILDRIGAS